MPTEMKKGKVIPISFRWDELATLDLIKEKYGEVSMSRYVKSLINRDLGISEFSYVAPQPMQQPKELHQPKRTNYNVEEERDDLDF